MVIDPASICVVANARSGGNCRDAEALGRAMAVFGPGAALRQWEPGGSLQDTVARALSDGFTTIVAAGGDGTVNGVAQALLGREGAALAVLPLGTFNFFARGIGLPEAPEAAAEAILGGSLRRISVGTVNGQVFLNNASLGVYPLILQMREEVYARYGRSRLMAYWTVIATLLRVQASRRMVIHAEGQSHDLRSPLLFVARSAYQLETYGLPGIDAIRSDRFAIYLLREGSRWAMLRAVAKLALRRVTPGGEIDMLQAGGLEVTPASRRPLVALDGERRRIRAPLRFEIVADGLTVVLPAAAAAIPAGAGAEDRAEGRAEDRAGA